MGDYRGASVATVSECARCLRFGWSELTPRGRLRILLSALRLLPTLIRFLRGLPRTDVTLSDSPSGLAIAEHLSLRRWGIPRFRLAQGVLFMPDDFGDHLRGRRKQALRTNMRRAQERGIECHHRPVSGWKRPDKELARSAPAEHWWATAADGTTVAEAWLTVDAESALLHYFKSTAPHARWLLHAAIVERLCERGCHMLMTNSYDAPLMSPGQQYFQRLLGYSVARLRYQPSALPFSHSRLRPAAIGALAFGAVAVIVAEQAITSPIHLAGHRAMVWLTALIAIRIAANRTGWATGVGAAAGAATGLLGAAPTVALAYALGGLALDLQLALLPRLTRNAFAMACVGPIVMLVTLVAPAFPTLGHHPDGAPWPIPPLVGAILFGALAALLGDYLGRYLRRSSTTAHLAAS